MTQRNHHYIIQRDTWKILQADGEIGFSKVQGFFNKNSIWDLKFAAFSSFHRKLFAYLNIIQIIIVCPQNLLKECSNSTRKRNFHSSHCVSSSNLCASSWRGSFFPFLQSWKLNTKVRKNYEIPNILPFLINGLVGACFPNTSWKTAITRTAN